MELARHRVVRRDGPGAPEVRDALAEDPRAAAAVEREDLVLRGAVEHGAEVVDVGGQLGRVLARHDLGDGCLAGCRVTRLVVQVVDFEVGTAGGGDVLDGEVDATAHRLAVERTGAGEREHRRHGEVLTLGRRGVVDLQQRLQLATDIARGCCRGSRAACGRGGAPCAWWLCRLRRGCGAGRSCVGRGLAARSTRRQNSRPCDRRGAEEAYVAQELATIRIVAFAFLVAIGHSVPLCEIGSGEPIDVSNTCRRTNRRRLRIGTPTEVDESVNSAPFLAQPTNTGQVPTCDDKTSNRERCRARQSEGGAVQPGQLVDRRIQIEAFAEHDPHVGRAVDHRT